MSRVGIFISAVWKQWVPLLTGGSMVALVVLWQWTGHAIPSWVYPTVLLFTFLTASYKA
jgi:hypothetical protein